MSQYSENTCYIEKSQEGDDRATEELIRTNYPLAASIARRFSGRGVEMEDLIQIALIGMLKAIRTFDTSRGTAFSTYAVPLIIGEIRKFLRDDGLIKVSRVNKKNCAVLMRRREEFISKHGREPHTEELAQLSGLSREEVLQALNAGRPVASLSEPVGDDGDLTVESMVEDPSCSIEKAFDRIALSEALQKLPEQWRKIIMLRYYRDLSQQQTADILGLTQVKVSREEKKSSPNCADRLYNKKRRIASSFFVIHIFPHPITV